MDESSDTFANVVRQVEGVLVDANKEEEEHTNHVNGSVLYNGNSWT